MMAPVLKIIPTFVRDDDGAAAVEFALILPFLLLLLLGSIDLTEGVNARRKLVVAGSTVSDLVARVKEVDAGYARSVMAAGAAIMAPLDASQLKIVVSSVVTDQNGRSTVAWSLGQHATPYRQGAEFPLASAMKPVAGSRGAAVVTEVWFSYKPILSTDFLQTLDMAQAFIAQPRIAATGVTCTASGC
jgi:Flp pilus assembly protein TadG